MRAIAAPPNIDCFTDTVIFREQSHDSDDMWLRRVIGCLNTDLYSFEMPSHWNRQVDMEAQATIKGHVKGLLQGFDES